MTPPPPPTLTNPSDTTGPTEQYLWDGTGRPDPQLAALERNLLTLRAPRAPLRDLPDRAPAPSTVRLLIRRFAPLAVAAMLVIGAFVGWRVWLNSRPYWDVRTLAGSPKVGSSPLADGRLRVGDTLTTDAASSARLSVATLGSVTVDPGSRVRLLKAGGKEQRMELALGTIRATISAPPRLFFVDTPSGVAADLGCIYELTVDGAGDSLLHVSLGFVELSHNGLASTVPADALARTGNGRAPGAPWFEDATQPFIEALADFEPRAGKGGGDDALSTILAEARPRDSLTLWHLLSRVTPAQRAQVFARLAAIAPPPADVTQALVMALDDVALQSWWKDLATSW